MGYAIPVDEVKGIADYVIAECDGVTNVNVKKCDLGFDTDSNSSKAVYDKDLQATRLVETIVITEIDDDSLAKDIVQIGDVINSIIIDGVEYVVDREFALDSALWNVSLNGKDSVSIALKLTRDNEAIEVELNITQDDFTQLK